MKISYTSNKTSDDKTIYVGFSMQYGADMYLVFETPEDKFKYKRRST